MPTLDPTLSNLLSGLIGALIASVIAYLGAWRLQHSAQQRQNRATARAVYSELTGNGAAMMLLAQQPAAKGSRLAAIGDEAWRAHSGAVAVSVPPAVYLPP